MLGCDGRQCVALNLGNPSILKYGQLEEQDKRLAGCDAGTGSFLVLASTFMVHKVDRVFDIPESSVFAHGELMFVQTCENTNNEDEFQCWKLLQNHL
jgi:hypothetical protein